MRGDPFRAQADEMNITQRRVLGGIAGGLLAIAISPLAVSAADDYAFTPDVATLLPSEPDGLPPLYNDLIGTERWSLFDVTTGNPMFPDSLGGVDHELTFGNFTNDEFVYTEPGLSIGYPGDPHFLIETTSQFDLMNFGGGFENAWMDIIGGPNAGASDMLITPFGDFALFGNGFAELTASLAGGPL
ncbi:hypothetical protein PT015_16270 [Candidatus Mycobacterium wuenschmannii]|uniref:PEP-CTERM sorting domain-containing protein n=1 Tax=Candidatus Mycobacterium wuenschmannii TaxID=3027808 RepID=A0ABY8VU14_9MYCO|nr:hypothetical protein [Candidatus Mycobacterium wuenschmannii]WIM86451.1 hypothetical protein PT015_16270 [Candidatus Mycobacterium wuenschmannii]